MAEKLTTQQRLAVENRGGKLLVSAAAGSGKTKVLVDRLLSYILDRNSPANIDDFLIITFTKAAASELRGKIAAKLSEKIAQMPDNRHLRQQLQRLYLAKISTVHAFCSDTLREYAYRLDISADFRIAEEKECQEIQLAVLEKILEQAYQTSGTDPDFCAFVDTQGLGRNDYLIPQIILATYNSAQCHLNPDEWLTWCSGAFDIDSIADVSETAWGQYLIDDLHDFLDLQIKALMQCAERALQADGMEKPASILQMTVAQLTCLRAQTTWDGVRSCRAIDYGRLVFSKKCTDPELAERIKYVRNSCKKGLEQKLQCFSDPSNMVLEDIIGAGAAARGLVQLVKKFTDAYDRAKRSRRVLDYNDLEHRMLDLVLGKRRTMPTALAKEIGSRFREVLVDEYQDTNEVQDAIFNALTCDRSNCFMVGDVKQSIYQFRLADPGIFIEKYNTYASAASAADGEGRKVLLSSNFRSSGGVISAVNHVFSRCMSPAAGGLYYTEDEKLNEGIPHVPLPEPEVELHAVDVREDTYAEEASFVAERICQLTDGTHMIRQNDHLRPVTVDDIVILLRSPGSVGAHFMYALEQRGIRCTTGKGIDLLHTDEICVLRSLLQIISNPLQDIPLLAVLMSPVFGFTAEELAQMRSQNRYADIYGLLTRCKTEKADAFLSMLTQLRQDARILTLAQLIQRIFVLTRLDNIYAAMQNGEQRYRNLQAFCQVTADFERSSRRDLNQFLSYLELVEPEGLRVGGDERQAGAVTIMSIHTSKGLEFPVVFLAGLSRRFNLESARERVLCDKTLGLGLCCADMDLRVRYSNITRTAISRKIISDSISEEMRILYVAMTRARDRLIMTYASNRLDTELQSIAYGLDMYDPLHMARYVSCAGAWVLQSAMCRTDAGALFAVSSHPDCVEFSKPPWSIHVHAGKTFNAPAMDFERTTPGMAWDIVQRISEDWSFSYPYEATVDVPSKMTATQLKGRQKDQEVAANAGERRIQKRIFRKAAFVAETVTPQTYGNAVHAIMQRLDFSACTDLNSITVELSRLVAQNFITAEQSAMVDPKLLYALFQTPMGRRLQSADKVLREFKFSVLDDADRYFPGVTGEQILLQGVVDCAMIETDGITVLDFKTDRVSEKSLADTVEIYRGQVYAYSVALGKIYKMPIKSSWLYFFHLNCFVQIL